MKKDMCSNLPIVSWGRYRGEGKPKAQPPERFERYFFLIDEDVNGDIIQYLFVDAD